MNGFEDDTTDLLYKLDDRNLKGHAALREACAIAFAPDSPRNLLSLACDFLGLLGSAKLSRGTMLGMELAHIAESERPGERGRMSEREGESKRGGCEVIDMVEKMRLFFIYASSPISQVA